MDRVPGQGKAGPMVGEEEGMLGPVVMARALRGALPMGVPRYGSREVEEAHLSMGPGEQVEVAPDFKPLPYQSMGRSWLMVRIVGRSQAEVGQVGAS